MRIKSCILGAALAAMACVTSCAQAPKSSKNAKSMNSEKKSLVVFYSRTGENYAVGNIKKGNTHIVAEMIADKTGADLFEIKPVAAYPDNYNACVEQAKREKEENARPAIKDDINIDAYDTVYLGYPNWWGDMPMVVYTFLEKHKWQGKTVVPFCTNEGSGLSDTEIYIAKTCKGASVKDGLSMRGKTAQQDRKAAQAAVDKWLGKLAK